MNKYLILIVIVLLAFIGAMWQQVKHANQKWETAEANVKAYSMSLSKEGEKNTALQLTVDQLGWFKDSILQELDNTRKELKVKDKNLKALQAVSSGFTRTDTVTLRDTLFRNPSIAIDTLIGDKWYNVRLGLKYPSMVAVKPYFKSEKHIIVSSKKETVNPPKKFWLFRLFQKKHLVLHIDVVEKNPYVDNESSRYVEIIK
jgi:hypothetical protein